MSVGMKQALRGYNPAEDVQLDAGIAPYVLLLRGAGVETFESCEGGQGHAYPQPTIRFHGDRSEGLRALAVSGAPATASAQSQTAIRIYIPKFTNR